MSDPPSQEEIVTEAVGVTMSRRWDVDERHDVVFHRASGAHAWDVHEKQYLDLTSCSGAAPLGAGHPVTREAVLRALDVHGGVLPGTLTESRLRVAQLLVDMFPCAERALFFRTGSCATTAAVRVARVSTGRRVVLTSGFHGWHDWHLQAREAALAGRDHETVDVAYRLDALEHRLRDGAGEVAAVVVTPEVGYLPVEYYHRLEEVVRRHGALLVYDEVMTGLRYGPGGFHGSVGAQPDLVTVSKGVANGTALSAVLGRRDLLGDAQERSYVGNTYLREVTPFVVAEATLPIMAAPDTIPGMVRRGTALRDGLDGVFARHSVAALAFGPGAMFDVVFEDEHLGRRFYAGMLAEGVLMEYGGTHMVSAAVTDDDVADTVELADKVAAGLHHGGLSHRHAGGRRVSLETVATRAREGAGIDTEEVRRWW